jgi:hypothetical protein
VTIIGGPAHHRDDLLHGWRISGIQLPLVARRASGVVTPRSSNADLQSVVL